MKLSKIIITTLAITLLLTGCSSKNENEINDNKKSVEVKNKILNKEITITKNFLDFAEIEDPQKSIDELVNQKVIKSGKVNEDGSVTYIMTPTQHKEYLKSLKESFEESNQDLIKDQNNSIEDIKANDNFSKFDIYVNPDSYSSLDSLMALGFYIQGGFYRMFNGDKDASVVVNFINKNTNEVIETADSTELLKSDSEEISSKEVDVKIEELPYNIIEQEPDSIGAVYGKATFTNNSKYPIKYFELSGVMPSTNERTYFISADTVMPGETSPNFESLYEKNTSITKISYSYIKDDQEIYVDYDVKLDSYSSY